ncbi:predicted protein [Chaetoceros tenuissimus]|uniref:F-box domain-containing protein n=1 Tax=Chaetoceros tenuissimus TaxID=426638 RepID=A0AAD3DCZ1_9STRA|nr:predicted protein [Chaetoceros tenuissimus]
MKPTDSVQRPQQGLSMFESLPDDIFAQILTYFTTAYKQDGSIDIKEVAFLYKSFSSVSKRLRRYCDVFCQTAPINVWDQWQDNYSMIACICRAKMKMSSLAVRNEKKMRISLFLYILEKCDLSQLQFLDVRSFKYRTKKDSDADTIAKASEVSIPKYIFDQELKLINEAEIIHTDEIVGDDEDVIMDMDTSLTMTLAELMLRGIRNLGNNLPIQHLNLVLDFCDNENSAALVVDIITSCKDLRHLFFSPCKIVPRFLADVTNAIESLSNINNLDVYITDYLEGGFGIKSKSITKLSITANKCKIDQIICPNLKKLRVSALKFGQSFLDSFASKSLETLTFELQDFKSDQEENHRQQSLFVHNLIKMLPDLRTLDLRDGYTEDPDPIRLMIESNSLEWIDASLFRSDMKVNFTRVSCSNLKQLDVFVQRDFVHEIYYSPIEVGNEAFLQRLSYVIDEKRYDGPSNDEERADRILKFAIERTDTELLSTLDVPESCIISFQAYLPCEEDDDFSTE